MDNIPSIDELVNDHERFNAFVYTPLSECMRLIKERRGNQILKKQIVSFNGEVPNEILEGKSKAVLFRQIVTPNYEIRRFLDVINGVKNLEPFFGEHRDDKFTSNNNYKHSWGRIPFFSERHGTYEHVSVLDLVKADGHKISELKTFCGGSLLEFHHDFFEIELGLHFSDKFYNISPWLTSHGKTALNYYHGILTWFLYNAILFENFSLTDKKELLFTREVFLPAFIAVYRHFKTKPLITSFLPIDTESNKLWFAHPITSKRYVQDKIEMCYILDNL